MSAGTGEKTEQPTEKRLRDARKKGQVAKSRDLTSAVLLLSAVSLLWLTGGYLGGILQGTVKEQFEFAATFNGQFSGETAGDAIWRGLGGMFRVLTPIFAVLVIFAILANFLQTGMLLTFGKLVPRFENLNPFVRFKQNLFNSQSLIELGKTILKMVIALAIGGYVLLTAREDIAGLIVKPPEVVAAFAFRLVLELGVKIGFGLLIFGFADFFLQRFLLRRELKMTRREVRQQNRETEGDPFVKGRRRALHREILSQDPAALRNSDVVIADPPSLAVVLKYERGRANAPVVTAKGAGLMAERILGLAAETGIPVKREISLAHALFEVRVGREIPEALYEPVAVILQSVYTASEKGGES